MSNTINEILKEFREKFCYVIGETVDYTAGSGYVKKPKYGVGVLKSSDELETFLTDSLNRIQSETEERTIKIFEDVQKEAWSEEVHCTCLPHAIAKAKGELDE